MNVMKKILIVDDEFFFRNLIKDALMERYVIIEGEDGDEAIALADVHQPDLIIIDVLMPGKDGIEACRVLKQKPETRKIPVLLLSALSKKEDIILGLKAGADDYITKPICISEIIARVDAHLRTKDYYAELEYKDLRLLLELAENISAIRNPMTILRLIVEKMSAIIDVARCSIVSIDSHGDMLVKASSDLNENQEIKLQLDKYPEIRKSLESKQPVIINNVKNDPVMNSVRDLIGDIAYNSIVVIPIIKKESIIGTFFLRTATPLKDGITERIYKVCQLVANISANALENAILFNSMKTAQEYFEEMSIRDSLTKLYNHRHFYTRLEEEFSRAVRYDTPLSLIFLDIDDFKRINDNYGHTNGDEVIQKIGYLVKSFARESDIAARYGGDEFAVILPNTSAAGALDVANRLSAAIKNQKFDHLSGDQVTISVGVATHIDQKVQSFDRLVWLADEAMYKAKALGKDHVAQA